MNILKFVLFAFLFSNVMIAQIDNETILNRTEFNRQVKKNIKIKVNLLYGNEKLIKGKLYTSSLQNELKIETLKFYISNLKLIYQDGSTFIDKNGYHLINIEIDNNEFHLNGIDSLDIKSISFLIGVDENKALSGEMDGDLDPLNGMFWSWQSGFSSFKIEGVSPSCLTRKNEFILHIGGYKKPYNSLREISFMVCNLINESIEIKVDIKKLMNNIDLGKDNHIMSPGSIAMRIADLYQEIFSLND